MSRPDVAVVGAGIVGCAAAARLAARGATVTVFEREQVAAAASGRNSGILQHPLAPGFDGLHEETIEAYRTLDGVGLGEEPTGLLFLTDEPASLEGIATRLASALPRVPVEQLDAATLAALEPALAPDLVGCLAATGYPVEPAVATTAFAERAVRAGARIVVGEGVTPVVRRGRAVGVVTADGRVTEAGAVLVAAGPWTGRLIDPAGGWEPVGWSWGVTAQIALARPPRRPMEQAGMDVATGAQRSPVEAFSLVSSGGATVVGSSFSARRPDPVTVAASLRRGAERFVPAVAEAAEVGVRVCARPVSFDGLPLLGPVAGVAGLHVATGHGSWGVSIGPATARIVVDAILDGSPIPPAFAAGRFPAPVGPGGASGQL